MRWRLPDRISHVTALLMKHGFSDVRLVRLRPGVDSYSGWFRLRGARGRFSIFVTEYLSDGKIVKYSYVLLEDNTVVLRYDNAPHHPEVPTHPHHKHVRGRVEPLYDPSIEAFMSEISSVVERASE